MNDFERIRYQQSFLFWVYLGTIPHPNPYHFYGINPLTTMPTTVVFDKPSLNRASILQWSPGLDCWTFSENAGVRWRRVEFMDYIEKTDCLAFKPECDKW